MTSSSCKSLAFLVAVTTAALGLRLALASGAGYETDTAQFIAWADLGARRRLGDMYLIAINYPPGLVSVYWLLGKARAAFPILTRPDLRYLFIKTPGITADLVVASLVWVLVAPKLGRSRGNWAAALYLFNPAVISDSTIWGQSDGLVPLFPLLALHALERKAWWLVGPLLGAAMATKFQAFVLVVALLAFVLTDFGLWRTAVTAVAALLAFSLIALPFALTSGQFQRMLQQAYIQNIGLLPALRLGALNFWEVANPAILVDDYSLIQVHAIAVTPKLIGLALFVLASVPAMLAGCAARGAVGRAYALGMVAWSFFMFPTEIHERYLLPAVAFLSVTAPASPPATAVLAAVSGIHLYSCYFRGAELLAPAMRALLMPCFLAAMYHLRAECLPVVNGLTSPHDSPVAMFARWLTERAWLAVAGVALASTCAALAVRGVFHDLANEMPLTRLGAYRSQLNIPHGAAAARNTVIQMWPARSQAIEFKFPPVFGLLRSGIAIEGTSEEDKAACTATFFLGSPEGSFYASDSIAAGGDVQWIEVPLPPDATDLTLSVKGMGCGPDVQWNWIDPRLISWRFPTRWKYRDVVFLSDLADEPLWPWGAPWSAGGVRRDRSIQGNRITIAGHGFTKGLGMQAGSVISFRVPEGSSAFVTDIGYDDEVPVERLRAKVKCVVLVDGTEVYRSPELGPRQRIPNVHVSLEGARRITLVADAAWVTQPAAIDWGDARFVRGSGP
jgi:hypothetical protein